MNFKTFYIFKEKIFDWNDYYKSSITLKETIKNTKFSSENQKFDTILGNTYVYNCFFFYTFSSSHGGAIFYSKVGTDLLIEKCLFTNCSAKESTGAIRVTGGNLSIAFSCGKRCFAPINDAFSSVSLDKTIQINSVFESSIINCEAKESFVMYHSQGFINIKSLNLSNNKANSTSGLYCAPGKFGENNVFATFVSFSSFSNNTAHEQCILMSISYVHQI